MCVTFVPVIYCSITWSYIIFTESILVTAMVGFFTDSLIEWSSMDLMNNVILTKIRFTFTALTDHDLSTFYMHIWNFAIVINAQLLDFIYNQSWLYIFSSFVMKTFQTVDLLHVVYIFELFHWPLYVLITYRNIYFC